MRRFKLKSDYSLQGISLRRLRALSTRLIGQETSDAPGVTGSVKLYNCECNRARTKPTLVIAHNKTLAAQLCLEFRNFSDNAVEYFVSYYDYYQPEAYIPSTDTYIEKDAR